MSDPGEVVHEVKPHGWRFGGLIYADRADPRVLVPRRPKWLGRTLNFGRPQAWLALAGLVAARSAWRNLRRRQRA